MSSTTAAVLHTATSGQALRIPLNGRRATTLRGGLARTAKRHGLLFHYRRDGESLIAWCEPRKPKTGA